MQLTRAADYAVGVMIHLAALPPGSRTSRAQLALVERAPDHFLSKILQSLARAGMIASYRGVTGGFVLAKSPEELTMLDIVEAIDGPVWLNQCVDPGQPCARQGWCAAHALWSEAQAAVARILRSASIAELARRSAETRAQGQQTTCVLSGGQN
jgi:Rrf2 family protein